MKDAAEVILFKTEVESRWFRPGASKWCKILRN